jgi:putative DNA methylase
VFWARTVKSLNPAFSHVDVPLASSFVLSSKDGNEAYVQPVVNGDHYHFTVKMGKPSVEAQGGTTAGKRKAFRCLISDVPIDYDYIRAEGKAGRIRQKLMCVVADGPRGRIYVAPTDEIESVAAQAHPMWKPEMSLPNNPRDFKTPNYGLTTFADLFTPRQLLALTTFSDLTAQARELIRQNTIAAGMADDGKGLEGGGGGALAYAEAVSVYLGMGVSRLADIQNSLCSWETSKTQVRHLFTKQAIPMLWDFGENNLFADAAGDFGVSLGSIIRVMERWSPHNMGFAYQADAQTQTISANKSISTDPPYYDNIGYADLSDFFYIWLRKSLRDVFPTLLSTIAVPKAEELVATPYRHGSKEKAENFFLTGMTQAMGSLSAQAHPAGPITIYYAFKQSDTETTGGTSSTGWETFLEAVSRAGLQLTGTWPMRTELGNRPIGSGTNSLASSIVLVCRKRPADAPSISRREFIRELNGVLPEALDEMTKGSGDERSPVAPVDLSQAIIGPGMAVFSKYAAVLEADGSPMSVRTALQLINRFLAEDDFDPDTQFCLHWFEENGWSEGVFGSADVLARSKSTTVDAMKEAGVLQSGSGKVRLLKWAEYPTDWDPRTDTRTPVWEALHQLIRALKQGGESASGALLAALGGKAEAVRQLAYRLYTLCERLGQAEDARAYNELITSWSGIESAAASIPDPAQGDLFS